MRHLQHRGACLQRQLYVNDIWELHQALHDTVHLHEPLGVAVPWKQQVILSGGVDIPTIYWYGTERLLTHYHTHHAC